MGQATSTTAPAQALQQRIDREYQALDAKSDGWDTEAFYDQAKRSLEKLRVVLEAGESEESIAALLPASATAPALRPTTLTTVRQDAAVVVRRARASISTGGPPGPLAKALRHFVAPTAAFAQRTVYFKLYRVDLAAPAPEITALVTATGRDGGHCLQQNATWKLVWNRPASTSESPQLVSVSPMDYEEVETRSRNDHPPLADATASLLGHLPSYRRQLLPSLDHWADNLHETLAPELVGYAGLAVADVNGDQLDDLYLCHPGGLPNQILLQNPDGTLRDASRESGVDYLEKTHSALLVDLDNDGDQDLALIIDLYLLLARNDGAGHFTKDKLLRLAGDPMSVSSADYDNDGDLDLYICNYGNPWGGFGAIEERFPLPSYYDADNGGPNVMLENQGGWVFADVTVKSGLNMNNRKWSLAASWDDYDNDGDADLFVSNDFGRKNLYRNDLVPSGRATFTDVAAPAGVEDISPGMSTAWGDFDNDGLMDIYASNMFSGAGNRITFQPQFQPTATPEEKGHFQRFARGNALFRNQGDGTFRDVSLEAGVSVGRWAWASLFADMDNDGAEDILVTNGFLTQGDQVDL